MLPVLLFIFLLICLTVKERRELPGHYQYTVDIFTVPLAGIEQHSGNYTMTGGTGGSAAESGESYAGRGRGRNSLLQPQQMH